VRANLQRLREAQNLGFTKLARILDEEIGRPIPELGLRRIESGDRRVDVDDLMALAAALDVSPATLLMPDDCRRMGDERGDDRAIGRDYGTASLDVAVGSPPAAAYRRPSRLRHVVGERGAEPLPRFEDSHDRRAARLLREDGHAH
jgi:transcriptional regulator with XRE-family HTH domain